MKVSSYIIERVLRQFELSDGTIDQFKIVSSLGDVQGKGFPRELFQMSMSVVIRGLLNFAVFQSYRDWIFPYWVHRQLDRNSDSYVGTSQNPLLINITHRNWTALDSPHGLHEAIVDPRGLVTPLPREWSVDVWLCVNGKAFFPSLVQHTEQQLHTGAPCLVTRFTVEGAQLELESFVGSTNYRLNVLFSRVRVMNTDGRLIEGRVGVAVRPFNPEGVSPVRHVEFKSSRFLYVDKSVGIIFAEKPDGVICSNAAGGDAAHIFERAGNDGGHSASCDLGLAQACAVFEFRLKPGESRTVHYSIALSTPSSLKRRQPRETWRVSYEKRKTSEQIRWNEEVSKGAGFAIADSHLQNILDANRLFLLQYNDGEFISPGSYLYHKFWFRDAVPMIRALDLLGFHKRTRQVIDAFPKRLHNGFFQGPDGEWDSNGAVMWCVFHHYLLTRSRMWLERWYPTLLESARWIQAMRSNANKNDGHTSVKGLMPRSLSAEHLGTVDQYFWDSFWSLAGLRSVLSLARELNKRDAALLERESEGLERVLHSTLEEVKNRLGAPLIPASPTREFDHTAIGSISCIYPLALFDPVLDSARASLTALTEHYVDERGFFHPFIHSGYNPYLTMQLAHCFLYLKDFAKAWEIADTVFRQARSPFSLPEAIHPRTGGGAMGDGHHGWAAAEIVLFLRDCIVREVGSSLILFQGHNNRLVRKMSNISLKDVPTSFGRISCSLEFDHHRATLTLSSTFFPEVKPSSLVVHLPFAVGRVVPVNPVHLKRIEKSAEETTLHCEPAVSTIFLEI